MSSKRLWSVKTPGRHGVHPVIAMMALLLLEATRTSIKWRVCLAQSIEGFRFVSSAEFVTSSAVTQIWWLPLPEMLVEIAIACIGSLWDGTFISEGVEWYSGMYC